MINTLTLMLLIPIWIEANNKINKSSNHNNSSKLLNNRNNMKIQMKLSRRKKNSMK
jgi:hypothetical protein